MDPTPTDTHDPDARLVLVDANAVSDELVRALRLGAEMTARHARQWADAVGGLPDDEILASLGKPIQSKFLPEVAE
jgi:hypothetical protein